MADMKISDLPQAGSVQDAQQFEVNDAGNSRRVTFQMLREKIKALADDWYATKAHNHSGTYAPASHTHTAAQISDASPIGRNVLTATSQAIARSAIGAGTGSSNLALGMTATTAKPGNWKPHVDTDTTGQLPWARLSGVPDSVVNGNLPDALGVGSYILGFRNLNWGAAASAPGVTYPASQVRCCHLDIFGSNMGDWNSYVPSIGWHNPLPALSGTWRAMSSIPSTHPANMNQHLTLFLRIA